MKYVIVTMRIHYVSIPKGNLLDLFVVCCVKVIRFVKSALNSKAWLNTYVSYSKKTVYYMNNSANTLYYTCTFVFADVYTSI